MTRALTVALCLAAPLLVGFSAASTFDLDAMRGGGDQRAFTGSPTAHGLTCATCHQGDREADLQVTSTPPDLLRDGVFQPGRTYRITVTLARETEGLDHAGACSPGLAGCNRNLFTAEVLDPAGAPAGLLCPNDLTDADLACPSLSSDGTALIAHNTAIGGQSLEFPHTCDTPGADPARCVDVAALTAHGATDADIAAAVRAAVRGSTSWQFAWRAPTGVPAATLWVALVDGNGGASIDPAYADYTGDAVGLFHRTLRDANLASRPAPSTSPAALPAGPGNLAAAAVLALLTLLAAAAARRRT
ncbi:MAG: hypothetical protein R3F39_11790 [Myxococcota bacterium]